MKEEGDDIPAQVAMVTEEDGAPQVALITQDGAQQVQTLVVGMGWATLATGPLSHSLGNPKVLTAPPPPKILFLALQISES